jgi:hypothetical protein
MTSVDVKTAIIESQMTGIRRCENPIAAMARFDSAISCQRNGAALKIERKELTNSISW